MIDIDRNKLIYLSMMPNEVPICLELIDSAFKNNLGDTDNNLK
jgi:hypothetical protein